MNHFKFVERTSLHWSIRRGLLSLFKEIFPKACRLCPHSFLKPLTRRRPWLQLADSGISTRILLNQLLGNLLFILQDSKKCCSDRLWYWSYWSCKTNYLCWLWALFMYQSKGSVLCLRSRHLNCWTKPGQSQKPSTALLTFLVLLILLIFSLIGSPLFLTSGLRMTWFELRVWRPE